MPIEEELEEGLTVMLKSDNGGRNSKRDRFDWGGYRRRIAWAVLAAILPAPNTALAAGATLLTSRICQDPRDSIDYHWAKLKFSATPLFFMKNDGTVVSLTQNASFDSYDPVYIVAHGKVGEVGPFTSAKFAEHFKTAHPTAPKTAYFDSCSAATANPSASGSNLKVFNEAYKNAVKTLKGPAGGCFLVGNGDPSLAKAEYKYEVKPSNQQEYSQIVSNIMADWGSGDYAKTGKSYKAACGGLMTNFDPADVLAFVNAVFTHFTTAENTPISTTINYLELIKLNTGGKDFLDCGADHKEKGCD